MLKRISNSVKLGLYMALIAGVVLILAGCAGHNAAATLTSTAAASPSPTIIIPSVQSITGNVTANMSKLTSDQYDLAMTLAMSGTIKSQPQNIKVTVTGNGANDVANKKMQMNLSAGVESSAQGSMIIPLVYYMVDGWQYVQVSLPFAGPQWFKTKMDLKSLSSMDQTTQALQMLKTAVNINVNGTASIDSIPCYVLQVSPDLAVFSAWIKSFQSTASVPGTPMTNFDLSKSVKNLSIKAYVTRDNYLLKEVDISAGVTLNGADFGSSAQANDTLSADISQSVKISQYNQSVTITLPPEALNAKDVTGQ